MRFALLLLFVSIASADPTPPLTPDIPVTFTPASAAADYERREVMIPMRDGAKLHTIVLVPHGAKQLPIILTRTPYNATARASRSASNRLAGTLPISDDQFADGTYIRVFQDIRGKYGSEGDYVMTRPLRGPLNASSVDHSTDAYDTIDWLVKHVPETNGRVGMTGSSYEGFTVLMALIHPHPALKAAIPMCPMVDGWRGDDWFHNGAFRQNSLDYYAHQTIAKAEGKSFARTGYDDYDNFLRAGSTGDFARAAGLEQLPFWKKVSEHPAYDAFWQGQALDKLLAAEPLTVPTMIVTSMWDQEDSYGGITTYEALEPKDKANDKLFFVMGPWRHSGANYDAPNLGPIEFDNDTARAFRRDLARPFLDAYLKGNGKAPVSPVNVYETGTNAWRKLAAWPPSKKQRSLYLAADGKLAFDAPKSAGFDEYISDPAKPVPYVRRPIQFSDGDRWKTWLVTDQRDVGSRTDVLAYVSAPLTAPLAIAGVPKVDLIASTSGTDSDWVVKLIDIYPDEVPAQAALGGYELPVAMEIFRGRYRASFEHPTAIVPGKVERYQFSLPDVDHVFQPGHRIAVQIQSSWFPLYDRNPQTFVDNIFFAKPSDYRKATQRVYHEPAAASTIELPLAN